MRKHLILLGLGSVILLFQNCDSLSSSDLRQTPAIDGSTDIGSETPTPIEAPVSIMHPDLKQQMSLLSNRFTPSHQSLAELNLWRGRRIAAKCGPLKDWEVCFEGEGIPGSNQPSFNDWDNPIDDDWDSVAGRTASWVLNNQGSTGKYMMVDRTLPTLDGKDHTGHFWRRDYELNATNGFEAEFKIRVLAHSGDRGVKFHFFDDKHEFRIAFGPGTIQFVPSISRNIFPITEIRDNTVLSTFRIVKEPTSGEIRLWSGDRELFTSSELIPRVSEAYQPLTAAVGRFAPRIGFGDNVNSTDLEEKGAYELYFFRYRKAANPGLHRLASALPASEDCKVATPWNIIKSFESKEFSKRYISAMENVAPGQFGRSLEFDLQLTQGSDSQNGYSLDYIDLLGGILLTIYPDRIEMKGSAKPGHATYTLPVGFNTQEYNRYRLVRNSTGLDWNLYVNDNPIPVLTDIRSSGFSKGVKDEVIDGVATGNIINTLYFRMGPFFTPVFTDLLDGVDYTNKGARFLTAATATVGQIKWIDQAIAANGCSNL